MSDSSILLLKMASRDMDQYKNNAQVYIKLLLYLLL